MMRFFLKNPSGTYNDAISKNANSAREWNYKQLQNDANTQTAELLRVASHDGGKGGTCYGRNIQNRTKGRQNDTFRGWKIGVLKLNQLSASELRGKKNAWNHIRILLTRLYSSQITLYCVIRIHWYSWLVYSTSALRVNLTVFLQNFSQKRTWNWTELIFNLYTGKIFENRITGRDDTQRETNRTTTGLIFLPVRWNACALI